MVFPVLLEDRALCRVLFLQLVDHSLLGFNGLPLRVHIRLELAHLFVGEKSVYPAKDGAQDSADDDENKDHDGDSDPDLPTTG
jgi:hypothetical protein